MATEQITTTYNKLKDLGACREELEMLWAWLCKTNHVRGDDPIDASIMRNQFITPADILESNGVGFLNWVLARTPRWESSFYSWGGRWEGSFAWAKEVSGRVEPTKTLAKDLKRGDRIMFLGIERGVAGVYSEIGQITLNRVRGYTERFDLETLDAIGFTLIEPKREPRMLKAEQILVPENVGTKWRSLLSKHIYLVKEYMWSYGGALRSQYLAHTVDGDPVHLTSNTFADTWEEVLE